MLCVFVHDIVVSGFW